MQRSLDQAKLSSALAAAFKEQLFRCANDAPISAVECGISVWRLGILISPLQGSHQFGSLTFKFLPKSVNFTLIHTFPLR
jgi:hypothetical protein